MRESDVVHALEAYRRTWLPHAVQLPVLGIPVHFASNSTVVLHAVQAAFGAWSELPLSALTGEPATSVRVIVDEDDARCGSIAHRVTRSGLLVHGAGCIGVTDAVRRVAIACVSGAVVRDAARFRSDVLEALTWALLTRLDRQPFHAAAIVRDGAALLLHGPGGAGKSTLAYAALCAGFAVAADDIVFLQGLPRLRVWARSATIRLRPSVAAGYPQLSALAAAAAADASAKIAAPIPPESVARVAFGFERCGVCVLGQRRRRARLRRLQPAAALAMIDPAADAGFDVFAQTILPALERLVAGGAWLLEPAVFENEAVPLLGRMFDQLAAMKVA